MKWDASRHRAYVCEKAEFDTSINIIVIPQTRAARFLNEKVRKCPTSCNESAMTRIRCCGTGTGRLGMSTCEVSIYCYLLSGHPSKIQREVPLHPSGQCRIINRDSFIVHPLLQLFEERENRTQFVHRNGAFLGVPASVQICCDYG